MPASLLEGNCGGRVGSLRNGRAWPWVLCGPVANEREGRGFWYDVGGVYVGPAGILVLIIYEDVKAIPCYQTLNISM